MSLDFYLEGGEGEEGCKCENCGNFHMRRDTPMFFHANITHNLARMAGYAGLYDCLWEPNEHGFVYAKDIIPSLEAGFRNLEINYLELRKYSPENGWGTWEGLLNFTEKVLEACLEYPDARISVGR